jgi:hypothetical protein
MGGIHIDKEGGLGYNESDSSDDNNTTSNKRSPKIKKQRSIASKSDKNKDSDQDVSD